MNRHLTERELIGYQFKLASEAEVETAGAHLEACGECREHLEQLKRKFAALDLLHGEIKVSEDLISQVVERAKQPAPKSVIAINKYHWLGAVAAVLVLAFAFLIGSLMRNKPARREFAKGPDSRGRRPYEQSEFLNEAEVDSTPMAVGKEPGEGLAGQPVTHLDTKDEAERTLALGMPEEKALAGKYSYALTTAGTAREVRPEQISEQPPFAPASAIELVVLPRRDKVQLTIYNSADLTLVRERRNLTLKRGWNWLQFMWANTLIDPTSLGLEPLQDRDKIDIQQLVFPARLRELGRWLIRSEVSGQVPFEITYFTSGLGWRAFYMGTLSQDEKKMRLQGYVRVGNNSGEDYEKAQTRLIVGKVHILDQIAELAKLQHPYGRPEQRFSGYDTYGYAESLAKRGERAAGQYLAWFDGDVEGRGRKEIRKEGLSEYFLYTIEGTETIADKWGKRLLSFEAEDIAVKSLYKYDEGRWGQRTMRFVKFANDEEHNLGETPIPNGNVKIYGQANSEGYLSYVGGTSIKYIPVDEEVELNLGLARLVEVEPTLMDLKTDNYVFDKKENISGWDEIKTWNIKVTNTRTLPIEIEITRGFSTAYWTLQAEIPYEKHDATHARFKLELEPRSKRTFAYTVTTYHGVREEVLTQ
jgi:hypothetical protein